MHFDAENLFSDDQAITATAVATNIIDLGADGADVPSPNTKLGRLQLLVQVTDDFASAAEDGTLVVTVQSSDTKTGEVGSEVLSGATSHISSNAIAEADLAAGYRIELPLDTEKFNRYLGLSYTVAGSGNFTAGKITAGLVHDKQSSVA